MQLRTPLDPEVASGPPRLPLAPEEPWTWRTSWIVLYSVGVSERKIGEIVGDRLGHRYYHATVSRITDVMQKRVEAFRKRRLNPRYAVIYSDALLVKVLHPEAGIRKEAGAGRVRFPGFRGARGWEASVFVTDDLPGMEEAIRWTSPETD